MTRQLTLFGLITAAFGLGSYRVLGEFSGFNIVNLLVGAVTLLVSAALTLRRLGRTQHPALRRPTVRALGQVLGVCLVAALVYELAALSQIRFDWTLEGRFELAPATEQVLARLPDTLSMTLYHDEGDPRIRNTALLLGEMALGHDVVVQRKLLADHPNEEDRFGIGSSNSVVLELGPRWVLVERPTEGALFEGISQLVNERATVLYFSVGAGEGDLERSDDLGYTGLRAALETEGYDVRPLPLTLVEAVPTDAAAVVLVAPRRLLGAAALVSLERFIEAGGSLVVFVEPGVTSGIETLLAHYGLITPDALVIDPTSGPVEGDPAGLDPIAYSYSSHPVTRSLNHNRMTFFRRARSFALKKARPDDRLQAVVFSSGESWLYPADAPLSKSAMPEQPADGRSDYRALAATAELVRGEQKARILAFGDADFVSNRYLRALYNLDLVVNGIHWSVEREAAISLRPKTGGRQLVQFPVPLQRSIQALYGVGLLIPELLLLTGGLIWLRQRRA